MFLWGKQHKIYDLESSFWLHVENDWKGDESGGRERGWQRGWEEWSQVSYLGGRVGRRSDK